MADVKIRAVWIGDAVKQGISDLGDSLESLHGIVAQIGAALGLKSVVSALAEDEQAALRLKRTLSNLGVTAGDVMPKLADYFDRLGDSTQFAAGDITHAFDVMARGTQDVQGSLDNLRAAMDVAAATGMDLASAGELVARAMEGQVRPLLALDPALARYLQELEGIEDPATRARLAIEKVTALFGGQQKQQLEGMAAGLDAVRNAIMQLAEAIGEKAKLPEFLNGLSLGVRAWAIALREGVSLLEAARRIAEDTVAPKVGPQKGSFDNPIAMPSVDAVIGGAPIGESAFGANPWLPADRRQRGGVARDWNEVFRGLNDGFDDVRRGYEEGMRETARKIAEDQKAQLHAVGEELKSGLLGAFDAATQGGKAFVDYMKEYIKRALLELAAGGLINAVLPGADVGTGILGKIFGLGAKSGISTTIERNLAMRQARLG